MKSLFLTTLLVAVSISILICPLKTIAEEVKTSSESKSTSGYIREEQLGLRKVTLYDEKEVVPPDTVYSSVDPGESKRIERAYENAPPMIPHSVTDLLPIDKDFNACIDCHMPDIAPEVGATAIPLSHLINLRTDQDLAGELYQGRYFCTQCHAPQAVLDLVVENKFKTEFRKDKDRSSSRLIENMNEGVSTK